VGNTGDDDDDDVESLPVFTAPRIILFIFCVVVVVGLRASALWNEPECSNALVGIKDAEAVADDATEESLPRREPTSHKKKTVLVMSTAIILLKFIITQCDQDFNDGQKEHGDASDIKSTTLLEGRKGWILRPVVGRCDVFVF
jgi:hypothetical protein